MSLARAKCGTVDEVATYTWFVYLAYLSLGVTPEMKQCPTKWRNMLEYDSPFTFWAKLKSSSLIVLGSAAAKWFVSSALHTAFCLLRQTLA